MLCVVTSSLLSVALQRPYRCKRSRYFFWPAYPRIETATQVCEGHKVQVIFISLPRRRQGGAGHPNQRIGPGRASKSKKRSRASIQIKELLSCVHSYQRIGLGCTSKSRSWPRVSANPCSPPSNFSIYKRRSYKQLHRRACTFTSLKAEKITAF